MSINEFSQLYLFRDLIFNYQLNILFFLLSTILPLNIFYQVVVEVVSLVFFRDNILIPGLGTTNLYSKVLNFRLKPYSLDPISPGLQLLSPLLKGDNIWIRGKYYKNIIRHVNQRVRITYKAYISEYIEDIIYRGLFEDSR